MARTAALHDRPVLLPWWDHTGQPLLTDGLLRESAARLLDDPYAAFVAWKHRDIQQYNCWHEDRTAAGNGIEARVPFLDHRIVELLATIPPKRRPNLLWDKRILRRAVQDLLPADVVSRGKVSFFYGNGEGFTHRAMVRMLSAEDDMLVEAALAAPGAAGLLNPDGLRSMLRRLERDLEPNGVEFLLRVVNLGLLDQMTREPPVAPVDAPRYEILSAAPISDWESDSPVVARVLRRVGEPAAEDVLALEDGVLLLSTPDDPETLYITIDGQLEYIADEPGWSGFLRNIDGVHSLAEVLAIAGVPATDLGQDIRDALDAGVLKVTE
jgi:asparagine synthase (glutamine-hydrolysing)